MTNEKYMMRCLELASCGHSHVAPNPMVGCVIVHDGKIIGEGYHQKYGGAHAEVNAINSVIETRHTLSLSESTLFVNLEPCAHQGKTPPCADFIIKHKIPKVVIGCKDTHSIVSGKGIEKLKANGTDVTFGVLEKKCRELNKRFFTFHEKKRPYIILKWAQTLDGYIGNKNLKPQISNLKSQTLSHKWRSEEQAIMVGTNTALNDNPQLNVREWKGNNPVRIVIDKSLRLPRHLHLFDKAQPTIVFTLKKKKSAENSEYLQINFEKNIVPQILLELHHRNIQSLIVEGGAQLLNSFISEKFWDEARVFIGNKIFQEGIKAPGFPCEFTSKEKIGDDELLIFRNKR